MDFYLLILLIALVRPLTVLFHELGHAIPGIILTKDKVTMYVGSYGDPKKNLSFKLGKLEGYFRYNPFAWSKGICIFTGKNITLNQSIIYTATGPMASLLVGLLAWYYAFVFGIPNDLNLVLIAFMVSAVFDLFYNIIPRDRPITLHDGTVTYNDGHILRELLYHKNMPAEYSKAIDLYSEQKYNEAATLFESLLAKRKSDVGLYRLTINSYLQEKNYEKARELSEQFVLLNQMNEQDWMSMALTYSHLDMHDKALELYDKSLALNPDYPYSLNNKGYTYNLLHRYEEAIPLFDRAIAVNQKYAYAYNNRGLAKIKLGRAEEGLKDINFSIELDSDNSYTYRNLGIYYFDKGEFEEAHRLFLKAKKLDDATHGLNDLIQDVERRLQQ